MMQAWNNFTIQFYVFEYLMQSSLLLTNGTTVAIEGASPWKQEPPLHGNKNKVVQLKSLKD